MPNIKPIKLTARSKRERLAYLAGFKAGVNSFLRHVTKAQIEFQEALFLLEEQEGMDK